MKMGEPDLIFFTEKINEREPVIKNGVSLSVFQRKTIWLRPIQNRLIGLYSVFKSLSPIKNVRLIGDNILHIDFILKKIYLFVY